MKARLTTATLVVLASALATATESAAQRLDVRGLSRVSVSGTATIGAHSTLTAVGGFSRFTHRGLEFGGDVIAAYGSGGTTGAAFFRVSQNFVGESLTVPFVTGGRRDRLPNEAGANGYRFAATQGGETAFGGREAVVIMERDPEGRTYRNELNGVPPEFELVGFTMFTSRFGGKEAAAILQAPLSILAGHGRAWTIQHGGHRVPSTSLWILVSPGGSRPRAR